MNIEERLRDAFEAAAGRCGRRRSGPAPTRRAVGGT